MNVVVRSGSEAAGLLGRSALKHDCKNDGCAKVVLEPKLRDFDDCFKGPVRMGDVDMSVERNGHILWAEWKLGVNYETFENDLRAQILQAKAFTKNSWRQSFILVVGRVNPTKVERFRYMRNGRWIRGWDDGGTDRLKDLFRAWDEIARGESGYA